MAGDWIKMRVGLTNHPRVMRIAELLLESGDFVDWAGMTFCAPSFPPPSESEYRAERHAALRVTRYVTVTALLKFWGYANEHAKGDQIERIGPEDVDEIVGVPGFARAMEGAGWAEFDRQNGGLFMPNFEEHNTAATARSTSGAERQKRYRERQKATANSDVTRDVTVTGREEKRREEINTPPTPRKRGRSSFDAKGIELPDSVPRELWHEWCEDRRQRNKPITAAGAKRQLAQLEQYRGQGFSAEAVITHSIAGGFQGLYPPKRQASASQGISVPGPAGPDPALEKIKRDAERAAPMPAAVRELAGRLKVH